MRFFNTEGSVVAAKHYCIPPLARVNRAEVLGLIEAERYFVLHAPRQTGKTSALLYGLGRGRTDLLIIWPRDREPPGHASRFVIECKALRMSLERTLREGLEQTARYMDRCGSDSGHLVIFDRSEGKRWEDKIFRREESFRARVMTVWGM